MKQIAFVASSALAAALALGPAHATDIVMQSVYPASLPLLGDAGKELGDRVSRVTGGELNIEFNEPGALVPSTEVWDAVSSGAVDAAWYSPGFAAGLIPAAGLFTSPPFGPDVREYTAWYYDGGGHEMWNEIAGRYNIHSVLCTVLVPEASGWFRKPINSVEDLKGLKMRIFGLGANVMQKLGVEAQSLPPADTFTALRLGTIDAAEFSFPAIDYAVGMQEYASHYYFPGWHQQTSLITFIINNDRWESLTDTERAAIEEVCAANVARTMAKGEAIQLEPIAKLREAGVTFHKWSPEMLAAFRKAWEEVAAEMSAKDEDFKRAWESLQAFHKKYAEWADYGYLDN